MDRNYYNDYYRFEREHWWFRARLQILRNYIREHIHEGRALRILNVGAATGATSEMLQVFGEPVSIEFDKECIAFVQPQLPVQIEFGDVRALAFDDGTFDLVCAFDVIEHVEDHELAVREMLRVCRAGGHILVTVPALMSLWSAHDVVNHHCRRYQLEALEALFSGRSTLRYSSYFSSRLFPLIYLTRKVKNLVEKLMPPAKLKSDFNVLNVPILSNLCFSIFRGESKKINRLARYRLGSSIILHAGKQ